MATAAKGQDMPPPGGFKPLEYSRVPARVFFGGKTIILAHLAMTAGSLYLYALGLRQVEKEIIENRSSMLAITPLLMAERDREYLKQLRRNRDEEARLMKDVEGWEVGKYRGEPIYKSVKEDTLIPPSINEYFVHAHPKAVRNFTDLWLWN